MFKIETADKKEVLETLSYVKLQSNGVIILCKEEEAHGVLNKDHSLIYAFKDSPIADKYENCTVTRIDLDEYLEEYMKEKNISTLPERVEKTEADTQELNNTVETILTDVIPSLMMME